MPAHERFELTLHGHAYGGDAVGRDEDGRVVFVPFGIPGERVRVRLLKRQKRWARAALEEVLEASPHRIAPRCQHYQRCGGCHLQHMDAAAQGEAKAQVVRDAFTRIAKVKEPPIDDLVPSPALWNYRNKVTFSLTLQGELGFIDHAGRRAIPIEICHLIRPELLDLWSSLDLEAIAGLRQVELRVGVQQDRLVVFHGEGAPDFELSSDLPASIVWRSEEGAQVLAGEPYLMQQVGEEMFRVSAGSFFQVNPSATPHLVKTALSLLSPKPGQQIYDLFAGVGLFSRFLARAGCLVTAVESAPSACDDFVVNLDPFQDVALYQAPVSDALPALGRAVDAVLLDPPRAGLSEVARRALLDLDAARIVYVSCDPTTLARDCRALLDGGYTLQRVVPIDLFPQTFHVETVALLTGDRA